MLTRSDCNCWWQRERERGWGRSSFIWEAVERSHHASCWQDICQIGMMQLPWVFSVTLHGSSYPDIFLVGKIGSNVWTSWDSHDSAKEALHMFMFWIYRFTKFIFVPIYFISIYVFSVCCKSLYHCFVVGGVILLWRGFRVATGWVLN